MKHMHKHSNCQFTVWTQTEKQTVAKG